MPHNQCMYTAQGELVCRPNNKATVEGFVIDQRSNEPNNTTIYNAVGPEVLKKALDNMCNISVDIDNKVEINCSNASAMPR